MIVVEHGFQACKQVSAKSPGFSRWRNQPLHSGGKARVDL